MVLILVVLGEQCAQQQSFDELLVAYASMGDNENEDNGQDDGTAPLACVTKALEMIHVGG